MSGNEGLGSVPDDSADFDDNWMLGFEKFLLIDSIDALNFHFVEEVEVVPSPGKADDAWDHNKENDKESNIIWMFIN